jgi:hypothetical protein
VGKVLARFVIEKSPGDNSRELRRLRYVDAALKYVV